MAELTVLHAGRDGDAPFASYLYRVLLDGRHVADLTHTYRGDEHMIRAVGGEWIAGPRNMLQGGEPQPLRLTRAGIDVVKAVVGPELNVRS